MKKIDEYITITQAARHLGVSANTLRNWEKLGKIRAYRNPYNRYRLYHIADLENILKKIAISSEE